MLTTPGFESVAIVGNRPTLVAELSSLFVKPGRYLPVLDGPRMTRPDASNEIIRRINSLAFSQVRQVLLADLPAAERSAMERAWSPRPCVASDSLEDLIVSLKGVVKRPRAKLAWGQTNLGIGLYLARRGRLELQTTTATSPTTPFISAGTHLLVACEEGEELAQICASNLAFASNASFLVILALSDTERDEWLEQLYAIGEGGDATGRFSAVCNRARSNLPEFPFQHYKQVLFVTGGFPWGIATPECATSHMYRYPDFGRAIVDGIWASQSASRSARNALLIDPQRVEGSEISGIVKALWKKGTLTRVQKGPSASVHRVQTLFDTLPFDIIAISTHAGDAPGERATYEYIDSEGYPRRLTLDHARGFGYDPETKKVFIQEFERFHELDGVDWTDAAAKAKMYVGTAIISWVALGDILERNKYKVHSEEIPRVMGSMALQLHDSLWIVMVQGFAAGAAPVILNNACSSWHELGQRLTFAGARAYIGTLFPVTDAEAQEVGRSLFGPKLGQELSHGLWSAQNEVYGSHGRRPYAMVGLPYASIRPNTVDSVSYMIKAYRRAIKEYEQKAAVTRVDEIRINSLRYISFLHKDFETFNRQFGSSALPAWPSP